MVAEYASLSGNRKIETLAIKKDQIDFKNAIIRTQRAKQRGWKIKTDLIEITPKMEALLLKIPSLSRNSNNLFPTMKNTRYTSSDFRTMWNKCILDAIKHGIMNESERFTFHDLRAYYTTPHKLQSGTLPDIHANPATTARIYERSGQSKRSAL